ncbi:MAG: tyrosine-type recombinase/integrase [Verrucomicrobiota bacterium]
MRSTSPSDRTFPQNRISGSILWLMVSLLCFRNHTLSRAHMVVQLFFQNCTEQCLWEICPKYPSRSILSGVHISVFFRTNAECTLGEALALTLEDMDLEEAYCCVRETKFFKSRLVPLGGDLKGVLTDYLAQRNKSYGSARDASVFCSCNGLPLSQSSVRSAFRRLRSHAGVLREGGPRRQPRLHDLRHTAAVHRLSAWYRSGEDMHQLLPKLATYLGHLDLSGTQCYLTLTPELLSQASQRFERYVMEPNHD